MGAASIETDEPLIGKSHEGLAANESKLEAKPENPIFFKSKLNPIAKEWKPENLLFEPGLNPNAEAWYRAPEIYRTLYFTFSHEYPLTHADIAIYFRRNYGRRFVERLYVNQPQHGPPKWGKIVFKSCHALMYFLGGNEQVAFCIKGRRIWFKQYSPKADERENIFVDFK